MSYSKGEILGALTTDGFDVVVIQSETGSGENVASTHGPPVTLQGY